MSEVEQESVTTPTKETKKKHQKQRGTKKKSSRSRMARSQSADGECLRHGAPPSFAEAVHEDAGSPADVLGATRTWSVAQLRVLLDYAHADCADCLERADYVRCLEAAVASDAPAAARALEEAQCYPARKPDVESWTIPELECALARCDVDCSDCLEQSDYVALVRRHPEVLAAARASADTAVAALAAAATPQHDDPAPDGLRKHRRGKSAAAATGRRQSLSQKLSQRMNESLAGEASPAASDSEDSNSSSKNKGEGKVDNEELYKVLGVARDASAAAITRAYYALARQCHPDTHPDDAAAEERFRQISEAYQVLSDPAQRAQYDACGARHAGPHDVVRLLFGAGRFDAYFPCPLLHAITARAPSAPAPATEGDEDDEEEGVEESTGAAAMLEVDDATVELYDRLATGLLELLVRVGEEGLDRRSRVREFLEREAAEMGDAPGGPVLLALLGRVYAQEAKQNSRALLGIPALLARARVNTHVMRETIATLNSAAKMDSLARSTDADAAAAADDELVAQGLRTLWRSGKLEIETSIRTICETVFNAAQSSKERQQFSSALKAVGKIFKTAAKEAAKNAALLRGSPSSS